MTDAITRSTAPAVMLINGEAGVGKSHLVAAAGEIAADSGVAVLGGWCLPLSQDLPLLPVLDVVRRMSDVDEGRVLKAAIGDCPAFVGDELVKLLPELGDGRSDGGPSTGAYRHRLFEALRRVLASFSQLHLAAVVIEDVHWADGTTIELLDYLVAPGHHPGLPVVLTYRSGEVVRPEIADWMDRLRRDAAVQRIDLSPLSRDETAEQIALLLGETPSAEFVDTIFGRTEGNAFFTEQLVSYSTSTGSSGLPPEVASLVLSRASQGGDPARALLSALTVAGRGLDDETLAEVCERSVIEVRNGLRDLTQLRLLRPVDARGQYQLRHALLGEALSETILPGEARDLHGRVGVAMSAWPDHAVAAEAADHFEAAGLVEREFALRGVAARYAENAAAPRDAARHWQRMIELWDLVSDPDESGGSDLVGVYGRALRALDSAGNLLAAGPIAQEALARLGSEATGDRAVALCVAVGRYLPQRESLAATKRAVELGAALPPSREYVQALSLLADHLTELGHWEERNRTWRQALDVATLAGFAVERRQLQAHISWIDFLDDRPDDAERGIKATLAIRPEPPDPLDDAYVLVRITDILLRFAEYDRILDLARPAIELAEATGHGEAAWVNILRGTAAEALLESGDVAGAAAVLDAVADSQLSPSSASSHLALARLNVCRGRLDEAAALWADCRVLVDSIETYNPWYRAPRDRLEFHFWRGDPLSGVAQTLELFERPNNVGNLHLWCDTFPSLLRALAEVAQDARLTGEIVPSDDIAGLYERLIALTRAGRDPFDLTQCSVRVAPSRATWQAELSRYEGASDPNAWASAATAWAEIGSPFAAGYAQWRQAEALLAQRGRRTEAIEVLRTGRAEATNHVPLTGAIVALARRARIDLIAEAETQSPVQTPTHPLGLTDREQAVLQLVGQGLSNREIGRALFISSKTVSVHVTSIMRKMGVTTRVQAATVAARSGLLDR